MNYLAHAYLSGTNESTLVGNFIADGIRGNKIEHLSNEVLFGIKLHRFIDVFTDEHELNLELKKLLYPSVGKYAGVVLDVVNDYFLANNWQKYSADTLQNYCSWCYTVIDKNKHLLPERTAFMYPYMKRDNWLYNYSTKKGILRSLEGLTIRRSKEIDLTLGGRFVFENAWRFEEHFNQFFPQLCSAVTSWIKNAKN